MHQRVKFLTEVDTFEVDLPSGVAAQPEMTSTVSFDGGTRKISFEPKSLRRDPRQDPALAHRFDTRSGSSIVSVYELLETPTLLAAFWPLDDGWVWTFIQDDQACGADLAEGLREVIRHLRVSASRGGLPTVDIMRPLKPGDPREEDERDMIKFQSTAEEDWVDVRLQRLPAWARSGESTRSYGATSKAEVRTSGGIGVSCLGPTGRVGKLRDEARRVADSITPD